MPSTPSPDPYLVLGIPLDADDARIRAAFHAKVRAGAADATVNAAYGALRDAQARQRRRWCDPRSVIASLPQHGNGIVCSEDLIREIAFLSDWELGHDHA
jgi:hypothetical protein